MSDQIKALHEFTDSAVEALKAKSAAAGKPITCAGKGCCHCCYEPVYCSTAEVEHAIEGLTPMERIIIGDIVAKQIKLVSPTGLLEQDLPPVLKWLELKLACPFLQPADGTCGVYSRRPYSCRIHLAIKHPDTCRDDRLNQKYAMFDDEVQGLLGKAIVASSIGGKIHYDNMLVLLHNALNGEHMESASAFKVVIEDVDKK